MTTIDWTLSPTAIEAESFRRIEAEVDSSAWPLPEWRIVRRLIHTTGDCGLASAVRCLHDPVTAGLTALAAGVPIYCDSSMIAHGLSLERLRRVHPATQPERIRCHVGDPDVAEAARQQGLARSLAAVEKAAPWLDGSIALIGNAPLALAAICRDVAAGRYRPALVVGMPVGFVHVEESKQMLADSGLSAVLVAGRRGGSPLAVATVHAIIESA